MSDEWYYFHDGQQHGPVSARELKALAASGQLLPSDLVWEETQANWIAAAEVDGLFPSGTTTKHVDTTPNLGADAKDHGSGLVRVLSDSVLQAFRRPLVAIGLAAALLLLLIATQNQPVVDHDLPTERKESNPIDLETFAARWEKDGRKVDRVRSPTATRFESPLLLASRNSTANGDADRDIEVVVVGKLRAPKYQIAEQAPVFLHAEFFGAIQEMQQVLDLKRDLWFRWWERGKQYQLGAKIIAGSELCEVRFSDNGYGRPTQPYLVTLGGETFTMSGMSAFAEARPGRENAIKSFLSSASADRRE